MAVLFFDGTRLSRGREEQDEVKSQGGRRKNLKILIQSSNFFFLLKKGQAIWSRVQIKREGKGLEGKCCLLSSFNERTWIGIISLLLCLFNLNMKSHQPSLIRINVVSITSAQQTPKVD
jgi:hypothetical protein